MPKLIDNAPRAGAIGEDGLERFCAELNAMRARAGIRQKYYLYRVDGLLKMGDEMDRKR